MPEVNGLMKPVEDGKVVDGTASGNSPSSTKTRSGNTLDKDAFLQLLVAQMKYQDPLEPTSNTEYISQLATFSSLEEMQNLNKAMTNLQGTNLVGKQVVLKVTSEATGSTNYVSGYVDYVTIENGKTFLVVEGTPYNIEDLESVVDEAYLEAISLAESFKDAVSKLPKPELATLDDKESIEAVRDAVNKMTGYQQGFLDVDSLNKLKKLLEQLAKLEGDAGDGEDTKPTDPDAPDIEDPGTGEDGGGNTTGGEGNG